MKGKKTINQKIETPGNKKTKPISVSDISPLGKMTRKPSPKQAELSSDTTGTRDESSVDIFSSQLLPGAEQGLTPDTVQQYPHQTAGVGSMNERVHPMPYAAGVNYPQGYFPPSENQYGAFYQAQQALPLFKSYFSSIGYPNQIRTPPDSTKGFYPTFCSPSPRYSCHHTISTEIHTCPIYTNRYDSSNWWSIGTNSKIGTNRKGCHSNGSVGEYASH